MLVEIGSFRNSWTRAPENQVLACKRGLQDRWENKKYKCIHCLHCKLKCSKFAKVMVNFCSMANCLNRSRNRPDLSFFCFPSEGHFRRLWKDFCRRSDPEFQNQKNPRISSAHFEASSIKESLCGRKEVIPGELPKYFNPSTHQCRVSSREKRLEEEKK